MPLFLAKRATFEKEHMRSCSNRFLRGSIKLNYVGSGKVEQKLAEKQKIENSSYYEVVRFQLGLKRPIFIYIPNLTFEKNVNQLFNLPSGKESGFPTLDSLLVFSLSARRSPIGHQITRS